VVTIERLIRAVVLGGALLFTAAAAQALPRLLIVASDSSPPTAQMTASGQFESVAVFDAESGTPALAQLLQYDVILAYTNSFPQDAVALGDVLADAVDAGRGVTVATGAMSQPWAIGGRIQTAGYNPLGIATNGDVSGSLTALVPTDPIFNGVALGSVSYFNNENFAHPTLVPGATLLATDGAGINMIARSASGRVMGMNLFPSTHPGNNAEFFKLVANVVSGSRGPVSSASIPVPTLSEWSLILMALSILGIAACSPRLRSTPAGCLTSLNPGRDQCRQVERGRFRRVSRGAKAGAPRPVSRRDAERPHGVPTLERGNERREAAPARAGAGRLLPPRRPARLQRQSRLLPPGGALRVPVDCGVAQGGEPFGGIPGHPAVQGNRIR